MRRLFSKDEVNLPDNQLVRIIRSVFYHMGITVDGFVSLFGQYWRHERRDPDKCSGQRHNLQRRLQRVDAVTWKTFENTVLRVLGVEIEVVTIRFRVRRTGKTFTISSNMIATDDGLMNSDTGEIIPNDIEVVNPPWTASPHQTKAYYTPDDTQ